MGSLTDIPSVTREETLQELLDRTAFLWSKLFSVSRHPASAPRFMAFHKTRVLFQNFLVTLDRRHRLAS